MMRVWHCALTAAALCLPQTAAACGQLSENVWMCARDTAWETATWEQNGDSATIRMQAFALSFAEVFPGTERADETTSNEELHGYYSAFLKDNYDDDSLLPQVIQADSIELADATAHRVLQLNTSLWDGHKYLEASMIAQVGTHQILLELQGPEDMAVPMMAAEAKTVLSYLRTHCADPISCADDYDWPPTAPLKEE